VVTERIGNDLVGFARFVELLADAGETADDLVPVAIETSKGLLVAALAASGRTVYPINPLSTSRYRDRHRTTRAKSDTSDAVVLANILRTDRHAHRPLPDDSELFGPCAC
jgi:transposase